MPFPNQIPPSVPDASPEPDFLREALNQIHRDAQSAPDTATRPNHTDVRSAVRSVARTLYPRDRAPSTTPPAAVTVAQKAPPAAPDSAEAVLPEKNIAVQRAASSEPKKRIIPSADGDASRKRAERSRRNRTRAAARTAHNTGTDAGPAASAPSAAPQSAESATPVAAAEAAASVPHRKRRRSRKKRLHPAWIALAAVLVLAVSLTAAWFAFGYRSCEATAIRLGKALYRADAASVFALYPTEVVDDLMERKNFTDKDKFFARNSKSLQDKWEILDRQLGADWTADFSYQDKSESYANNLKSTCSVYQSKYGVCPDEARWIVLNVSLKSERGETFHTRSVILLRFGTWWYVYDTPNLTF
jgi:hypothetical protein